MTESHLQKCQSRVVGISFGKGRVELYGKPLKFGVAPIGIIGAGTLGVGLVVVGQLLDILRNNRWFGSFVWRTRIFVIKSCHQLMTATGYIAEYIVKTAPVVDDSPIVVTPFYNF